MINNNPYSQPDRPQQRASQGYQKSVYRFEERSQNTNVNSIMKKSAIILGHQGSNTSQRPENSLFNFTHSPRHQPYHGNFSLPRNSNPNISNTNNQEIKTALIQNQNLFAQNPVNGYNSLVASQISNTGQQHKQFKQFFEIRANHKMELKIRDLEQKIANIDYLVSKHENKLSQSQQFGKMQEIRNLLSEMREVKRISEEDDIKILEISNQLMFLKQEIKQISNKTQLQINQKLEALENYVFKTNVINEKDIYDKINCIENSAMNWEKPFEAIRQKLMNLEKQMQTTQSKSGKGQTQIINKLIQLEESISRKNMQQNLKKSFLKSSCTPIVLKYVEIFRIKWGEKSSQRDINISQTTYYIDSQGNLLDDQNRFIMDYHGNKIKLQEKHINLLKMHDVLK